MSSFDWYRTPSSLPPRGIPILVGDPIYGQISIKYTVTRLSDVPAGIEQFHRREQDVLNRENQQLAKAKGIGRLAELGRQRQGMVDTGQQVFFSPKTQIALTRAGLRRMNFGLKDLNYFQKRSDLFTITAVFAKVAPGEKSQRLSDETSKALAALAERGCYTTYIWDNLWLNNPDFNPDMPETWKRNITINCNSMQLIQNRDGSPTEVKPENVAVINNGVLGVYKIGRALTTREEEQEDVSSVVDQLFEELEAV